MGINHTKQIYAGLLGAIILASAGAGVSERQRYIPLWQDEPARIYTGAPDTEDTAPPGGLPEFPGRGVTYTYSYASYKDRVTSDICSNSPLSEYLADQFVNHAEEFSIRDFPGAINASALLDAVCEAYYQNNAYIGGIELNQIRVNFDTMTIRIPYVLSAGEQQQLQKEIASAADSIAAQIITPGMSDFQKEEAICDYFYTNAKFDFAARDNLACLPKGLMISYTYKYSQTAYGVLINHTGVCQSYAEAFKLIADSAGLPCIVVTGVINGAGSHMWNRVYINDQWKTLDVTNSGAMSDDNVFINMSEETVAKYFTEDNLYVLDNALYRYR